MENCLLDLAKNEVQSLVSLIKNEAQYLCCFSSYVEKFDQRKEQLAAKHQDMKRKFQKGRGVYSFKNEARQWEREADKIINIDTKIKKKFFLGWCPNCWWQYQRGKELAEKTQYIEELLERCNSDVEASRANVSNINHISLQDFIHFNSRESEFQHLMEALQNENCNMIGLEGMGGVGKTSMAKEVGHKLEESKLIDKIIFLVVSKPPDFKEIRGKLAEGLDLSLEEVKEEELSSTIFSRITKMDKKLLIILDDVWEKFDLVENLGIPSDHKDCNLLITTRNSHVCREMGGQVIELNKLNNKEALNLFEAHANMNNSTRGLKGMPEKIVKHCGGIPIVIVAIARALKNQPARVWKDALKTLEDHVVDPNLEEAYKCLKLSYDNLKNEKAKELFLISSLFPEDYQVPIQFLTKIGIGLGWVVLGKMTDTI
ncbi:disease resistance protein SUMM2-like [Neltuma alba]|uniref:disease resistance protein SUMM2-like n=1 Tax=Neltuma alba TaxID=207710 RepID=UPI0010A4F351|nr:disease resistance protein SUMM2-like [Prosopis alba]